MKNKIIRDTSIVLPELTLEEKNAFLDWAIKRLERIPTFSHYLCLLMYDWILETTNLSLYINVSYNTALFPELLERIRKEVIKTSSRRRERLKRFVIDNAKKSLCSSVILVVPFSNRIKYRAALLKSIKREINK